MLVLSIDTSSSFLGLGIYGNGINDKILEDGGLTHSVRLLPRVQDLLKSNDVKIKDVDKVVVAIGPGSFTGIRIGVATANAFSLGLNIPVVGVSTLEAMASSITNYDGLIISTMDAQRGCFYVLFAKFENGKLINVNKEAVYSKEEIVNFTKNYGKGIVIGDALKVWDDMPECICRGDIYSPDPLVMCQMGIEKIENTSFAEPVYIRKSQAEVEYDKRNGV